MGSPTVIDLTEEEEHIEVRDSGESQNYSLDLECDDDMEDFDLLSLPTGPYEDSDEAHRQRLRQHETSASYPPDGFTGQIDIPLDAIL